MSALHRVRLADRAVELHVTVDRQLLRIEWCPSIVPPVELPKVPKVTSARTGVPPVVKAFRTVSAPSVVAPT